LPIEGQLMRAEWIAKRRGHANVTQLYYARQGVTTEEMLHVAKRERLPAERILREVASGRMIIPANVRHAEVEPRAICFAANCTINATSGSRRWWGRRGGWKLGVPEYSTAQSWTYPRVVTPADPRPSAPQPAPRGTVPICSA
jgi:hypothetical protein